ncbi:MAG: radical SAM protein [Candidatus Micrarchaeota archaeon]
MKSIDVTLVYPKPTLDSPQKAPALSMFYPGASLEKAGFEVEYSDERFDPRSRTIDLAKKSEIVGLSSMTGHQIGEAHDILVQIREANPEAITVLGGVHPTILPKQCLSEANLIDFVVLGEGEKNTVDLVKAIKSGQTDFTDVAGIGWKKNGVPVVNERCAFINPAEIPFPVTEKNKHYFEIAAKNNEMAFPSSRGCPHKCRFCYNMMFNRHTWRPMPLEKWSAEVTMLKSMFEFSHLAMGDDNIGPNVERIKGICNTFKSLDLTWHTGIRCDYITRELVKIMDDGGCRGVLFGVESGNDRVLLEIVGKDYREGVESTRKAARIMGETNISSIYSFMCNLPTETHDELLQSMELADYIYNVDKNARISFYVYAPYPGSEMYELAVREGFKEPTDMKGWSRISLSNAENPVTENLYYLSGLRFRGKKGDRTDQNFPGLKRLIIAPFELEAKFRWRMRWIDNYGLEKNAVKKLFNWASDNALKKT